MKEGDQLLHKSLVTVRMGIWMGAIYFYMKADVANFQDRPLSDIDAYEV